MSWFLESFSAPHFVGSVEDEDHVYFFFRETAVEYINCGKVSQDGPECDDNDDEQQWLSISFSRAFTLVLPECARMTTLKTIGQRSLRPDSIALYRESFPFTLTRSSPSSRWMTIPSWPSSPHRTTPFRAVPFVTSILVTSLELWTRASSRVRWVTEDCHWSWFLPSTLSLSLLKETVNSNWLPLSKTNTPTPRPGQCRSGIPSESDLNFIKRHTLLDEAVSPVGNRPLFIWTSLSERLSTVAINDDFIFAGTNKGRVLKISSQPGTKPTLLEALNVFEPGVTIKQIAIDGENIVAQSEDEVVVVPVTRCDTHKMCDQCIEKNSGCKWDLDLMTCVLQSKVGYFYATNDDECPKPVTTTTTTTTTTTSTVTTPTTSTVTSTPESGIFMPFDVINERAVNRSDRCPTCSCTCPTLTSFKTTYSTSTTTTTTATTTSSTTTQTTSSTGELSNANFFNLLHPDTISSDRREHIWSTPASSAKRVGFVYWPAPNRGWEELAPPEWNWRGQR